MVGLDRDGGVLRCGPREPESPRGHVPYRGMVLVGRRLRFLPAMGTPGRVGGRNRYRLARALVGSPADIVRHRHGLAVSAAYSGFRPARLVTRFVTRLPITGLHSMVLAHADGPKKARKSALLDTRLI